MGAGNIWVVYYIGSTKNVTVLLRPAVEVRCFAGADPGSYVGSAVELNKFSKMEPRGSILVNLFKFIDDVSGCTFLFTQDCLNVRGVEQHRSWVIPKQKE